MNEYLEVTDQALFGLASPFDIVDGGKAALVQALCDVTSNVKEFPADSAPYGGYLMGRLAGRSELSTTAVQQLSVFVEVDKPDHVKLFKQGLESAKKELGGGGSSKEVNKTPRPVEERAIVEKTGMDWVEQVALRGAMAMGVVLSREQIQDLGYEGDVLDSHKFRQMIKAQRPWYMTFVRKGDAKGLKSWLKRAVSALAVSKYSKASACLNLMVDELSELTIDQGFMSGFIEYYNEHMELRRCLPLVSESPLDDAILRRKVTGVRGNSDGLEKASLDDALQKEALLRKGTEDSLRKAFNKIDALEALVRKLEKPTPAGADSRPSDANRCYECGEVGHFGRDCPVRKAKDKKEAEAAAEAAKKEK